MSGPKALAQSVPPYISLGGEWRRPVLHRLKFTSTASGATVTPDADNTTPGMSVGAFATNSFPVTFTGCRKAQVHSVNCAAATPGTVGNHRQLDCSEPSASAGTLSLFSVAANGGAFSAPLDGSVITLLIWLDL